MRKVNLLVEESQLLTRAAFATIIYQIFPEIQRVQKFSREGKILIDDALNWLFNSFDNDRTGKISYKKLCTGLDVLCENDKGKIDESPVRTDESNRAGRPAQNSVANKGL